MSRSSKPWTMSMGLAVVGTMQEGLMLWEDSEAHRGWVMIMDVKELWKMYYIWLNITIPDNTQGEDIRDLQRHRHKVQVHIVNRVGMCRFSYVKHTSSPPFTKPHNHINPKVWTSSKHRSNMFPPAGVGHPLCRSGSQMGVCVPLGVLCSTAGGTPNKTNKKNKTKTKTNS